ncbi:hypothetical protein HELRODRAFT_179106 [Helobdella robusta]|uniref:Uncharacterized protein n=1 Tax=Helobdella robusta TaxID=6412 RepID=T1FE59_HELRO|nr:hypothetical protein HELRODRAFT_179106 [Helobdella robusta]ESN95637.1 hypothetical protein HELRODRAFT_179106 [Helobdella robusta]
MHQRSCKMFKSLRTNVDSKESSVSSSPNCFNIEHQSTQTTVSQPLPGVTLPKSTKEWTEANIAFYVKMQCLNDIDIDDFATHFQQIIYSYFAKNYGLVQNKSKNNPTTNALINQLKKELMKLKAQNGKNVVSEIISQLSKMAILNNQRTIKSLPSFGDAKPKPHRVLSTKFQQLPLKRNLLDNNPKILYNNQQHYNIRIAEDIFIESEKPFINIQQRITTLPTRRMNNNNRNRINQQSNNNNNNKLN